MTDDTKRLFFKSNKHWHEAMPHFLRLVSSLVSYLNDEDESPLMVCNILLLNEGFLESAVQTAFWTSYRPDLVKEYDESHCSLRIKTLETCAHSAILNLIINIGRKRSLSHKTRWTSSLRLLLKFRFAECNVNYVVGLIRLLKNVNANVHDRWSHFDILLSLTNSADHVDNGIIAEVIKLGSNFMPTLTRPARYCKYFTL